MRVHTPSWFVLSSKATADIHIDALASCVVFTSLAMVFVVLRLLTRVKNGGLRLEDYVVVVAVVLQSQHEEDISLIAEDSLGWNYRNRWRG